LDINSYLRDLSIRENSKVNKPSITIPNVSRVHAQSYDRFKSYCSLWPGIPGSYYDQDEVGDETDDPAVD
jgi:hypothetical protein